MIKQPLPCYFPGDFLLPNKYDLQKALWLSRKSQDVSTLTIVIGKDEQGELPGSVKEVVWKNMLSSVQSDNINVIRSKEYSPLAFIYKYHESKIDTPFCLALDLETAEDKSFQETFEQFLNYEIIITPKSPNEDLSQDMIKAVQNGDLKTFSAGLNPELNKDKKKELYELIMANMPQIKQSNDDEPPVKDALTTEWWDRSLKEMYEKFNLKS